MNIWKLFKLCLFFFKCVVVVVVVVVVVMCVCVCVWVYLTNFIARFRVHIKVKFMLAYIHIIYYILYQLSICNYILYQLSVPVGSPSRGGDVAAYVFNLSQPSLPTPFYSALVSVSVFMTLSTVFHFINSPNNSLLSHSVLLVSFLPYWSFQPYISLWKTLSALI